MPSNSKRDKHGDENKEGDRGDNRDHELEIEIIDWEEIIAAEWVDLGKKPYYQAPG
jgi:hypothetical protein